MADQNQKTNKAVQILTCPTCSGEGKMTVTVWEENNETSSFKTKCINCDGEGKVDAIIQHQKEAEANRLWCSCRKSSGASYINDGESEVCHKHHWICNDCNKIVQIG